MTGFEFFITVLISASFVWSSWMYRELSNQIFRLQQSIDELKK